MPTSQFSFYKCPFIFPLNRAEMQKNCVNFFLNKPFSLQSVKLFPESRINVCSDMSESRLPLGKLLPEHSFGLEDVRVCLSATDLLPRASLNSEHSEAESGSWTASWMRAKLFKGSQTNRHVHSLTPEYRTFQVAFTHPSHVSLAPPTLSLNCFGFANYSTKYKFQNTNLFMNALSLYLKEHRTSTNTNTLPSQTVILKQKKSMNLKHCLTFYKLI